MPRQRRAGQPGDGPTDTTAPAGLSAAASAGQGPSPEGPTTVNARDAIPAPLRARLAPEVRVDRLTVNEGVVSLDGYGIRLGVERGHLAVMDGAGRTRRAARFAKATCGIKRVVIRGAAFVLTGDALAWLTDIGATLAVLDYDGRLVAQFTPRGPDDSRLRRAQALAPYTDTGPALTKYLLRHKLGGQIDVLRRYYPDSGEAVATIEGCLTALDAAETPEMVRYAEGLAAAAYWSRWADLPLTFVNRDRPAIPEHWRTFGSRLSPLSQNQYNAANPANALLNYLNALLESETRVACVAVGLDPGLGLFHTDRENRDSLALDLMEPVRPRVEAWLIELLRDQVWGKGDFVEMHAGVCRLMPEVCHLLAATAPAWQALVAPYARHIARELLARATPIPSSGVYLRDGTVRVKPARPSPKTTLGTGAAASARAGAASRLPVPRTAARALVPAVKTPPAASRAICRECGAVLDDPRRAYCDECAAVMAAANLRAGTEATARARAAGASPAQSEAARAKRAARARAIRAEQRAWEVGEGATARVEAGAETFTATILPGLLAYSASQIAKATGLTTTYVAGIKAGKYVPHRRHWDALGRVGELIAARREALATDTTRAERARERKLAQFAWERAHGKEHDRGYWVQEIAPRLRDFPVSLLVRETGLSLSRLNTIKRGKEIPHPMHWEAFARIVGVTWPPTKRDEHGQS